MILYISDEKNVEEGGSLTMDKDSDEEDNAEIMSLAKVYTILLEFRFGMLYNTMGHNL